MPPPLTLSLDDPELAIFLLELPKCEDHGCDPQQLAMAKKSLTHGPVFSDEANGFQAR